MPPGNQCRLHSFWRCHMRYNGSIFLPWKSGSICRGSLEATIADLLSFPFMWFPSHTCGPWAAHIAHIRTLPQAMRWGLCELTFEEFQSPPMLEDRNADKALPISKRFVGIREREIGQKLMKSGSAVFTITVVTFKYELPCAQGQKQGQGEWAKAGGLFERQRQRSKRDDGAMQEAWACNFMQGNLSFRCWDFEAFSAQPRNFPRGLCNYGDNCRFSHVVLGRWKMTANHGCCLPTITTLAIRHNMLPRNMQKHEASWSYVLSMSFRCGRRTCWHYVLPSKVFGQGWDDACYLLKVLRQQARWPELFILFRAKDVHWQGLCDPLHCNSVVASCDGGLWASAPRIWWWGFLMDRFLISEGCDFSTYRG